MSQSMTKVCSKCREAKPYLDFAKQKASKDGLQPRCRACNTAYKREWNAANRDRQRKTNAKWRSSNEEYIRETNRRYQQEHRDELRQNARQYLDRLRVEDPVRLRLWELANNARRRGAAEVCVITRKDYLRLLGQPCVCGATEELTLDHLIPLSRGGRHAVGNLMALCRACNTQKHDRFLVEWRLAACAQQSQPQ